MLLLATGVALPAHAGIVVTENTKLTANVVCTDVSTPCIRIAAPGVTLDLGGFTVTGPHAGMGVGIAIDPGVYNVTIRNGTVTGFETGVLIEGESAGHALRNVTARRNSVAGIHCDGAAKVEIDHSSGSENGEVGILIENSTSSYIHHSVAQRNGQAGLVIGSGTKGARVERNVSRFNDGDGIVVEGGAASNAVSRNTAAGNADFDLRDDNGDCTGNLWSRNLFNTKNVTCID
jgi:hypothetical protein